MELIEAFNVAIEDLDMTVLAQRISNFMVGQSLALKLANHEDHEMIAAGLDLLLEVTRRTDAIL